MVMVKSVSSNASTARINGSIRLDKLIF